MIAHLPHRIRDLILWLEIRSLEFNANWLDGIGATALADIYWRDIAALKLARMKGRGE